MFALDGAVSGRKRQPPCQLAWWVGVIAYSWCALRITLDGTRQLLSSKHRRLIVMYTVAAGQVVVPCFLLTVSIHFWLKDGVQPNRSIDLACRDRQPFNSRQIGRAHV